MKNLMIVALISMSIMACKNDEKKDDNIDEITPDDLRVFDTYLNKYILLITDLMKYFSS